LKWGGRNKKALGLTGKLQPCQKIIPEATRDPTETPRTSVGETARWGELRVIGTSWWRATIQIMEKDKKEKTTPSAKKRAQD